MYHGIAYLSWSNFYSRQQRLWIIWQFFLSSENETNLFGLQNLVIGTDDEKAMVKAIKTAFPESTHVLCSGHLKQNVIHKLTDDAVTKSDRNEIVNQLFGVNGIVNADDTICFEQKCDDFATYCGGKSEKFLKYFEDRLKTQIKTKLNEPARKNKIDTDWTYNNSESINHVLKQSTDWKKKPLMDIVYLSLLLCNVTSTSLQERWFDVAIATCACWVRRTGHWFVAR